MLQLSLGKTHCHVTSAVLNSLSLSLSVDLGLYRSCSWPLCTLCTHIGLGALHTVLELDSGHYRASFGLRGITVLELDSGHAVVVGPWLPYVLVLDSGHYRSRIHGRESTEAYIHIAQSRANAYSFEFGRHLSARQN